MTDRELMQQALDALESLFSGQADLDRAKRCSDAITALRAALAEPVQEPVAQAGRPPHAQLQALCNAQIQLIDDYQALLAKTLPALIRLGDFVGNVDEGGASGLGRIDRCALIREVKNAIGK